MGGGQWAASLDVPPLPLKSNTRSYVSGCLLSQQPGPEVSPALSSRVREGVESPWVQFPCTSQEGDWRGGGRGDLKVKGWKKAAREGVRINANRKEIHRRNGSNPVGASKTRDQSGFFGTKTKKKIQKKSSPAIPCSAHFFLMEFQCRCAFARVSFLPPSLPLLSSPLPRSRSLLWISALPHSLSLPLPTPSLPAPPSARPLPPPSRLPRLGSRASPLSSARGSAPRLPGDWRRGASAGARRSIYTLQRLC